MIYTYKDKLNLSLTFSFCICLGEILRYWMECPDTIVYSKKNLVVVYFFKNDNMIVLKYSNFKSSKFTFMSFIETFLFLYEFLCYIVLILAAATAHRFHCNVIINMDSSSSSLSFFFLKQFLFTNGIFRFAFNQLSMTTLG